MCLWCLFLIYHYQTRSHSEYIRFRIFVPQRLFFVMVFSHINQGNYWNASSDDYLSKLIPAMIKIETARFMICAVITGWNIFLLGAKRVTTKFPKLSFSMYIYVTIIGWIGLVRCQDSDSIHSSVSIPRFFPHLAFYNPIRFALILKRFVNEWLKQAMSDGGFPCWVGRRCEYRRRLYILECAGRQTKNTV